MQKGKEYGLDFDNPELVEKKFMIETQNEELSKKLSILKLSAIGNKNRLANKVNRQNREINNIGIS